MLNYRLSPEAKEDLYRIYKYGVLNFGEKKADEYFNNLFKNFERIAKNPFHYPSSQFIEKNYRKCVSGEDTIYFRVDKSKVIIVSIIRSQDIGTPLK